MESPENSVEEIQTPETVSPTANWAKPIFKGGLKLKPKLKLRRDGDGASRHPNEQPQLNRINPNQDELLDAITQLQETVDSTRHTHARIFNGSKS